MAGTAYEKAAALLLQARRDRRPLAALPEALRPRDAGEGYAIQAAVAAARGGIPLGWKIGNTSAAAQRIMGYPHPFFARLFADAAPASPAVLRASDHNLMLVESEFALELGTDLPAAGRPYGRQALAAAVAAVRPVCEIIDTAYADITSVGLPGVIADNGIHGMLVLGAARPGWPAAGLDRHPVACRIDGEEAGAGIGAAVLGHPLAVLEWLVDALAGQGLMLRRGDLVSTGTCAGAHSVRAGQSVVADFGTLGSVAFTVTG